MNISRILFFIGCIILQGCADPTTVSTGAQIVYNRNSLQKTLNDTQITAQAYQKVYVYNDRYKNTNVTFATFNGVLIAAGQVPNKTQRNEIDNIIHHIPGPQEIHNLIVISTPASPITQISDAWITTKIKSKFIASNDIDPGKIKIVTENGTVYLMGTVMHDEADYAVELARTTDGVQNVVKVFTYLTASKV